MPVGDVSRETVERLGVYKSLLSKWTKRINLVSTATLEHFEMRHVADSAQLFKLVHPESGCWADLGSGGGLPGVVVAILAAEKCEDLDVTLVESDQRKAAFLRTVSRETGTRFNVVSDRAEKISPLSADFLSARALAPLGKLLAYSERHLKNGGVAIFPKGARHAEELAEAQKLWRFEYDRHRSVTDPNAAIYMIRKVHRA